MNEAGANERASGIAAGPGAVLLAERRRQNLSLGDISRQLKLSVRQVEALERDDFSGFQSAVFVHGFLRNYSKLLGMSPEPLILAADQILNPAPAPVPPEERVAKPEAASASKWPLAAAAVLVLLIAGGLYVGSRGNTPPSGPPVLAVAPEQAPARPSKSAKPEQRAPTEKLALEKLPADKPAEKVAEKIIAEKPADQPRPAPVAETAESRDSPIASAGASETGDRVIVRMIFEQDSWVEIKDRNGNTIFGQLNAAGSRRSVSGEAPLSVVVGNAAGVLLFRDDKGIDLSPHTRVDVARLTIE